MSATHDPLQRLDADRPLTVPSSAIVLCDQGSLFALRRLTLSALRHLEEGGSIRHEPGRPKLWLVGLTCAWLVVWCLSVPRVLLSPDNHYSYPRHDFFLFWKHTFLFSTELCEGGVYESGLSAVVVGGVLWAMAALLGLRWFPHRRGVVLLGFIGLYGIALVVLSKVVAPPLWGATKCFD